MLRAHQTSSVFVRWLLLPAMALFSAITLTSAAEGIISIELNKVDDTEQGCRPLFLFDNQSGHQLNRFQVELVIFDGKGIYSRQILLDMAPLYKDKKVVASFMLNELACDEIGSMLVNTLPSCANSTGSDLDCIGWLEVTSKSSIPLEK